jgi:hypothetical protein
MSLRLNLDQLHRARGAPLDARQREMVRRMRTASEHLIEAVEALLSHVKRAARRPSARPCGRRRPRRLASGSVRRRGSWRSRSRDRNRTSAPASFASGS